MRSLDLFQTPSLVLDKIGTTFLCGVTVALCVLGVSPAYAQDVLTQGGAADAAVRVRLTQARVEMEAGKEKLVDASCEVSIGCSSVSDLGSCGYQAKQLKSGETDEQS
jgi:hypothetical protein